MKKKKGFNYYWRLLATGLSFAIFNLGGLGISILVFPFIEMLTKNKALCKELNQKVLHYAFRFFFRILRFLGVLQCVIQDAEKLKNQSAIFIANHPTLLDYVLIISVLPKADCIVKQEIWNNFFLRPVVRSAGYISNAEPDKALIACLESLKRGYPIIIFPEGTRSDEGKLLKFERGAANIAIRGQCDIVPLFIRCEPPSLAKGVKWHQIPDKPMILTLQVGDKIHIFSFIENNSPSISARKLTRYLEELYQKELYADE
jgi:1-acyl-sn-glycerol-3-phosphate acyltransferase